jgi:hypothetical protein
MSTARQITKIEANQENGTISAVWTQFDGDGEIPGFKRPGRLGFTSIKFADALDDFYSVALDRLSTSGIWDSAYRKLSVSLKWNAEDGADVVLSLQGYPEPGNSAKIATVKLSPFTYYPAGHASRDDSLATVSGRYATDAEANALEELMTCAERWLNGESSQGNLLNMLEPKEEAIAA